MSDPREPLEPSDPLEPPRVRDATADDAAACAGIYEPYVTGTTVTFETESPDVAEMARRIAKAQARHAFLVLDHAGEVAGYAYGGPFKERAAYRWSCEVSVYLVTFVALIVSRFAAGMPRGSAGAPVEPRSGPVPRTLFEALDASRSNQAPPDPDPDEDEEDGGPDRA